MNNTAKLSMVDTILSKVPIFKCNEGCADCCGPVAMAPLERERIERRTGIRNLKGKMESAMIRVMRGENAKCPLLGLDNKCTVYDIRPAICRIFGASTARSSHACLECPHGCRPAQMLDTEQTEKLLSAVEVIAGKMNL